MTTTTAGTVEHIDPNLIVVEANIRSEATLPREFVDSIKQNGVLTPILARRDEQGNVIVRAGQRRTLAARAAGLETIPAYIIDADETTTDRIVQQMVENDQREAVTDADRVAAFQQLAFEGLSPAVIAKRTGTKAATVKAGIAVAASTTAASAITSHSLTLDQAATLIEFENDPETVADLIDTASTDPARFAHAAQRARDDARVAAIVATANAEMAASGYTILDSDPSYYNPSIVRIRDLVTSDGNTVTEQDVEAVEGRAVYIRGSYNSDEATITYFLTDHKAAGFKSRNGSESNSGPMTDDRKDERKILIANNKAWASAETVRRTWLTEFLGRKTLPKDTD
jgi:ParB family chromosome partitioning protein